MKRSFIKKLAYAVQNYLTFFLLIAFLVTCTTTLFVRLLTASLNVVLTSENLASAAKLTFVNVIFLSLILTIVDAIRRKFTVERSTKHIVDATKKIVKGDFSVRVTPINKLGVDENFNEIIRCFNQMAEELSGVETLRTDFISNVSHEMKTPLAVIQNYGKLLQSENISKEEQIEYAKGVTNGARRLSDMMTNILKLNRLENQQIYPKTKAFDLGEQLCECLLQFESTWEKENIEINTDIEENILVSADDELLYLVWNNLLSNAFKFTSSGGKVSVSLSSTENHAIVKISDTGIGMSADVGAHIFEKFYQGDTSRATQGNGLGLALVKRVIDILNGEISVESTLGEGSTFTVKIRRAKNGNI